MDMSSKLQLNKSGRLWGPVCNNNNILPPNPNLNTTYSMGYLRVSVGMRILVKD
jgi:hypothetical protein